MTGFEALTDMGMLAGRKQAVRRATARLIVCFMVLGFPSPAQTASTEDEAVDVAMKFLDLFERGQFRTMYDDLVGEHWKEQENNDAPRILRFLRLTRDEIAGPRGSSDKIYSIDRKVISVNKVDPGEFNIRFEPIYEISITAFYKVGAIHHLIYVAREDEEWKVEGLRTGPSKF